jgi:hypothetical protein
MSYQAEVAGWHDFFIVAGTASATLVGLLVLLVVSLRNTWDLLVTVADVTP